MRRMGTCVQWAALTAIGTWCATGCVPATDGPEPINVAAGWQAEYVVADAAQPTALAFATDGRVFYTEKSTGNIRVVKDGVLAAQPLASVPVNSAGDRGLLGIALHPRFQDNRRVYVFYTRSDTGVSTDDPRAFIDHRVVYFVVDEAEGVISTTGETFVASIPVGEATVRIGGRIAFAADRTLLVAVGDGTDVDAAQDDELYWGKVLRYNDDGTIPADNPNPASPIYARGFREPRGLTLDPDSGYVLLIERSLDGLHEVNRLQTGTNYGWPLVVGFATTAEELAFVAEHDDYADPMMESTHQLVGGGVNPSTRYGASLLLRLFFGWNEAARVASVALSPEGTATVGVAEKFATGLPTPINDVAFTPAGTLYIATDDAVLRVVEAP